MNNEKNILSELKNLIIKFSMGDAELIAKDAIAAGIDPLEAASALMDGIKEVGDAFSRDELFLPDLACAAETLKKALPIIMREIEVRGEKKEYIGKVIIGTVFGDIHSIGKSMVATLLYAAGFEVIDLGVNVKANEFIKAVDENKPDILAMSALLTTTAVEQKNVIKGLIDSNLRNKVKIIVGGSPINQEFADSIGADGYGSTAPDGVTVCKKLLGIGE